MDIGDIVVRRSYDRDITFKVIDIKETSEGNIYILKGINLRIIADSLEEDLELVDRNTCSDYEEVFNRKVNTSIKKILLDRTGIDIRNLNRSVSINEKKDLSFGRPGKILHVDGDAEYLEVCLKVYKQLSLDAIGKIIKENEQPKQIVNIVKAVKPDIVIITGHDGVLKDTKDFMDLDNYKNSRHFVEAVTELRNYEPGYDNLVIFAGACQSHYEAILDAGANFASSPSRVLIHCLDPVFICERIAYTNIEKVVAIKEALQNTISGAKGVGGLQTRGKYREGFPKSKYS
ncbi:sporulation peptidase YabG [uncultured Clostridium sp.]|uniref:sporulation peptidase YabG n=1 Tax=uncultured Clostridium sp. TaxID=59620 RepID=UPI0028E61609|nr:sporulation peptidase YabG [uncultured Clostridium sp.]